MLLDKYKYSKILNFLPVLIILIFGMLALHYSVLMINLTGRLLEFIPDIFNSEKLSEMLNKQSSWLYWSVMAVGFSGFILVVLNSSKLTQLKSLNEEKNHIVETLEMRLSALEVAQEGIFIVDNKGFISYMNKSLYLINGLDLDERNKYIGKEWLSIFSDDDRLSIEKNILSEFSVKGVWVGDFSMFKPDGSIIYVDLSLTILPDGGLIGTIEDITEKHKAESEKKAFEEQFYQAQKMEAIGRLAGGIAHDFNNILAAMNGYAEFLKDDLPDDSDQYKFADNILQAGAQARDLVDQMLAFSRTSESESKALDLIVPVSEAITMIQATMSKSVGINQDFSIPYAPILGNSTQISQLIMNLCVNAMDAMEDDGGALNIDITKIDINDLEYNNFIRDDLPNPKDSPIFRIEDISPSHTRLFLGHLAKNQDYVMLRVSDSGMGMSRIIMEHIFEPFFTTKPVDKGTGLGLSTVHGIIVSHKGFMVINSTLGKGTSFDIYFPLSEEIRDVKNIVNEELLEKHTISSKKHILLVEDQENVRSMIILLLERLGYEVSHAVNGLDALDMVRENPEQFDLIITDYNMPEMTGLEMAQQVHLDLPDIPFIMLSGYSQDSVREIIDGHAAIKTVIRKPVSRDILSTKIQAVLGPKPIT